MYRSRNAGLRALSRSISTAEEHRTRSQGSRHVRLDRDTIHRAQIIKRFGEYIRIWFFTHLELNGS